MTKYFLSLYLTTVVFILVCEPAAFARETKKERLQRHMIYREFLLELEQRFYFDEKIPDQTLSELLNQSISHLKPDEQAYLQKKFQKDLLAKTKVTSSDVLSFKETLFNVSRFDVAPAQVPNFDNAVSLYKEHCASCHGASGDGQGPLAGKMKPRPTDFGDINMAKWASPLRHLNVLVLGKKGTAMRGYLSKLRLDDLWDLSYFTVGLSFPKADLNSKTPLSATLAPDIKFDLSLENSAYLTNVDLWRKINPDSKLEDQMPPSALANGSPLTWFRQNASFSKKIAR